MVLAPMPASPLLTPMQAKKLLDACADTAAAWAEYTGALASGTAGAVAAHAHYGNNGGRGADVALTAKHWGRIKACGQENDFWSRGTVDLTGTGAVVLSGIRLNRSRLEGLLQAYGGQAAATGTKIRRPTYEHGLPIAEVVIHLLQLTHADRKAMKAVRVEELLERAYRIHTKQIPHSRNLVGIAGGIKAALEGIHGQLVSTDSLAGLTEAK